MIQHVIFNGSKFFIKKLLGPFFGIIYIRIVIAKFRIFFFYLIELSVARLKAAGNV